MPEDNILKEVVEIINKGEVSSIKEKDKLIRNSEEQNIDGVLVSSSDTRWITDDSNTMCNKCKNMKSNFIMNVLNSIDYVERKN